MSDETKPTRYWSLDEIVEDMIHNGDEGDRDTWRAIRKDQIPEGHHGIGRHIRNSYLLWDADNPYTEIDEAKLEKDAEGVITDMLHPDNFSGEVMERIWEFYSKRKG